MDYGSSFTTFAHEIGHNLGAGHDEVASCSSRFIMSEVGNNSTEFSSCSIRDIQSLMTNVVSGKKTLSGFKAQGSRQKMSTAFSICGDLRVQGDEECDCGPSYESCTDPCCYPSIISSADLSLNRSATPCRRHNSPVCIQPFRSAWLFGICYPWLFIGLSLLLGSTVLSAHWMLKRICFHQN